MQSNQVVSKFSIDEIDMIRDLINQYKAPSIAYKFIDHDKYPNISEDLIVSVKKDRNAYNKSWKYTQSELKTFMDDNRVCQWYTNDDIEYFCKTIIECDGDLNKAHAKLTNEGYSILQYTLYSLKTKKTYTDITSKYF